MFPMIPMFPVILATLAFAPMLLGSPYSVTLGQTLARHREGSLKSLSYPPEDEPGPEPLPAWVKRYQKAKSRGLIPSIRPAVLINGVPEYPFYSDSTVSNPRKVCSWTVSKCNSRRDIVNAPRGAMGISFDDGPQPPTSELLSFLKENEQKATHFMIGSRIHQNPSLLVETVHKNHDHIAVHTWSHMTTMTDEQILGEIGWTMQIINDLTGLVPAFWRPPYGDIDNRVRAISRHVFGLKTVMWSVDPNDWCLSDESSPGSECTPGSGPQNINQLIHDLKHRIRHGVHGDSPNRRFPKHGIISLEHELSWRTVQSFMQSYPLAKSLGWDTRSIPDLFGLDWYQKPVSNFTHTGILPILKKKPFTANHTSGINITTPSQADLLNHRNETAPIVLPHSHELNSSLARFPIRNEGHGLQPSGIAVTLASLIFFSTGFQLIY
ncbi:chitin deacetylase [Puccinia graminis f. sp. tritici]|uniref:Chitin deacetylase 3 n=2 Tax=Puccinia graminis f. sp. tritici TaxID=56615 RepID=A0A5B0MDD2_PUCGR|nr:chitin deacetylase [Puccinia graminis f. sp. tritici]KAA1090551.1 chitin deacetylase [Puccinia graminis f. sp. tritici]